MGLKIPCIVHIFMCVLDSDASYSQYVYSERKHDVAAECSLKRSIFFKILYLL